MNNAPMEHGPEFDVAVEEFLVGSGDHKRTEEAMLPLSVLNSLVMMMAEDGILAQDKADIISKTLENQLALVHAMEHAIDFLRANPMGRRISPN